LNYQSTMVQAFDAQLQLKTRFAIESHALLQ